MMTSSVAAARNRSTVAAPILAIALSYADGAAGGTSSAGVAVFAVGRRRVFRERALTAVARTGVLPRTSVRGTSANSTSSSKVITSRAARTDLSRSVSTCASCASRDARRL